MYTAIWRYNLDDIYDGETYGLFYCYFFLNLFDRHRGVQVEQRNLSRIVILFLAYFPVNIPGNASIDPGINREFQIFELTRRCIIENFFSV